jgi:hypothetical protein
VTSKCYYTSVISSSVIPFLLNGFITLLRRGLCNKDLLFNIGNHPMKFEHCKQLEPKLCSGNHNFQCKGHSDPNLRSYDPKVNRGHVLDMAVHPIKFYSCRLINTCT